MKLEDYERARLIREQIINLNNKKGQIEKIRAREEDEDFNLIRGFAHDFVCYSIKRLEDDFSQI